MPRGHRAGFRWITPEARFWRFVVQTDGCWEWRGSTTSFGYGQFRIDGKGVVAHRFSWTLHNGAIPNDLCVLHKCDTPGCTRPDHLFLGTKADNSQDALRKGRLKFHPENLALSPNHRH